MTEFFEENLRQALRRIADEGHVVPLGRQALTGVRRRRVRLAAAMGAAAALVLVVTLGAAYVPDLVNRPRPAPATTVSLPGKNIVASYDTPGATFVLNPDTGRYHETDLDVQSVSPDLRYGVGTRLRDYTKIDWANYPPPPQLGIVDMRSGAVRWWSMPWPVVTPEFSPDGKLVMVGIPDKNLEIRRVGLIDPNTREARTVDLALPAGRAAAQVSWYGPDRILALTKPEGVPAWQSDQQLSVLDTSGAVWRTVDVPDGWFVTSASDEGRVLAARVVLSPDLSRTAPPEVIAIDLVTGAVGPSMTLHWAGQISPIAWRGASGFLATAAAYTPFMVEQLLVVDLDRATVAVTVLDGIADAQSYVVVPAVGLTVAAAAHAF